MNRLTLLAFALIALGLTACMGSVPVPAVNQAKAAEVEEVKGEQGERGFSKATAPHHSGGTSGGSKTVHVKGYTTKNGTQVQPHNRSAPRR